MDSNLQHKSIMYNIIQGYIGNVYCIQMNLQRHNQYKQFNSNIPMSMSCQNLKRQHPSSSPEKLLLSALRSFERPVLKPSLRKAETSETSKGGGPSALPLPPPHPCPSLGPIPGTPCQARRKDKGKEAKEKQEVFLRVFFHVAGLAWRG